MGNFISEYPLLQSTPGPCFRTGGIKKQMKQRRYPQTIDLDRTKHCVCDVLCVVPR